LSHAGVPQKLKGIVEILADIAAADERHLVSENRLVGL
jgi:hypothetical protein